MENDVINYFYETHKREMDSILEIDWKDYLLMREEEEWQEEIFKRIEKYSQMSDEELEEMIEYDVLDDYYFNQYYIEKYRNDWLFNMTGWKVLKDEMLIELELQRRKENK